MESIFENGYLKTEFINPEYRGLVGWNVKSGDPCKLALITMGCCVLKGEDFTDWRIPFEQVEIKQFTPEDISENELVWVGYKYCKVSKYSRHIEWQLLANDGTNIKRGNYAVPYLIAKDEATAEKLKDWNKQKCVIK